MADKKIANFDSLVEALKNIQLFFFAITSNDQSILDAEHFWGAALVFGPLFMNRGNKYKKQL